MSKKYKFGLYAGLAVIALFVIAYFFQGSNFAVLNPKGNIATQQRDLLIASTLLMSVIVVPVLVLTFIIAWKYREGNTNATYSPDLDGNRLAETVWWTVPLIIIVILGGMIIKSSHDLDPFKQVEANKKPLRIQVVAMEWKWLFIYPEQGVASINHIEIPEDTPINFELTSDSAMNSFWIPQLGGQIYAMAGMQTKLHLIANEQGTYDGQSANLSGEGFSGMRFTTTATSDQAFNEWVDAAKRAPRELTKEKYEEIAVPSKNVEPIYFASVKPDLYDSIIGKYLSPDGSIGGHHGQ